MVFQALARLALTAVRPPKEAERMGEDGQRRRPSDERPARPERKREDTTRGPVLNTQGETTGKLIDTEA